MEDQRLRQMNIPCAAAAGAPRTRPGCASGFTLLELSMVIVVIAVVTTMGVTMGVSMIDSAKRTATRNTLDAIERALMAFRMANNRLPCPADETLAPTASNFGVEAANLGSCTGGTPAANYLYTVPKGGTTQTPQGTTVVEGAVPVKALNLPSQFAFDAYGNHIAYAVWTPDTAPKAFLTYGITPSCGNITVKDAGGTSRSTAAVYALVSYGPDGNGGYPTSGGATRNGAGVINADELTNCHCNSNGTDNGNYAATYVQKELHLDPSDAAHPFQQQVRYKERWQMYAYDDAWTTTHGVPCSPGFIVNGITTGDSAGQAVAVGDVNGDGIPDLVIGAWGANAGNGSVYVVFGTAAGFPDPLPLSSLNGLNGFEIDDPTNDQMGNALATGDVNGDGIADIIIGNYFYPQYNADGAVYVVFGQKCGSSYGGACTTPASLSNLLNGTSGTALNGVTGANEQVGYAVATGDVNGDGIADILIGANQGDSQFGAAYVVFGKKTGWTASSTLNSAFLNGTNGVEFTGTTLGGYAGDSVATGDVNGDGIPDVIIGASANGSGGSAYVVFGSASSWASLFPQTTITTTSGSKIITPASYTGLVVGQLLNSAHLPSGDRINSCNAANTVTIGTVCTSNIKLSQNATATAAGTAMYVSGNPLTTTLLNGSNGVELDGPASSATGSFVAAGDVNGDGIADLLIAAPGASPNGKTGAGSVYAVFGRKTGWTSPMTINSTILNGTNGIELDGVNSGYEELGQAMAIGDINGDGVADLLLGTYNTSNGSTYAVFGKSPLLPRTTVTNGNGSTAITPASYSGLMVGQVVSLANYATGTYIHDCNGTTTLGAVCTSAINLSNSSTGANSSPGVTMSVTATPLTATFLNGSYGLEFDGGGTSYAAGQSVAVGDVNGDGIADVVVGAPGKPPWTSIPGYVYVYFGHKQSQYVWPTAPYNLGGL